MLKLTVAVLSYFGIILYFNFTLFGGLNRQLYCVLKGAWILGIRVFEALVGLDIQIC